MIKGRCDFRVKTEEGDRLMTDAEIAALLNPLAYELGRWAAREEWERRNGSKSSPSKP